MLAVMMMLAVLAAEPDETTELVLPHMRVDRAEKLVDIDAEVVLREADWIELLACSPKSREHESILTVKARPSHIHLALITLGLEPGAPIKWHYTEDAIKVEKPHGPRLNVTILIEKDGQTTEIPAAHWILNQQTGKPLDEATWLFTGSGFADLNGHKVYRADIDGTVISIVNFGDDLMARQTDATNHTDEAAWTANTDAIPPVGTKVTLRVRVAPEQPASQPATQPAEP